MNLPTRWSLAIRSPMCPSSSRWGSSSPGAPLAPELSAGRPTWTPSARIRFAHIQSHQCCGGEALGQVPLPHPARHQESHRSAGTGRDRRGSQVPRSRIVRGDRARRLPALEAVRPGNAPGRRTGVPIPPVRPDQGGEPAGPPDDRGRRVRTEPQPDNYFADVEQAAFTPANLVPGISYSPDKMLQGRLFSYGDAARYRVGVTTTRFPSTTRGPPHW